MPRLYAIAVVSLACLACDSSPTSPSGGFDPDEVERDLGRGSGSGSGSGGGGGGGDTSQVRTDCVDLTDYVVEWAYPEYSDSTALHQSKTWKNSCGYSMDIRFHQTLYVNGRRAESTRGALAVRPYELHRTGPKTVNGTRHIRSRNDDFDLPISYWACRNDVLDFHCPYPEAP